MIEEVPSSEEESGFLQPLLSCAKEGWMSVACLGLAPSELYSGQGQI